MELNRATLINVSTIKCRAAHKMLGHHSPYLSRETKLISISVNGLLAIPLPLPLRYSFSKTNDSFQIVSKCRNLRTSSTSSVLINSMFDYSAPNFTVNIQTQILDKQGKPIGTQLHIKKAVSRVLPATYKCTAGNPFAMVHRDLVVQTPQKSKKGNFNLTLQGQLGGWELGKVPTNTYTNTTHEDKIHRVFRPFRHRNCTVDCLFSKKE